MEIQRLILGELQTNCYVFMKKEAGKCLIIDPADCADKISACMKEAGVIPEAILLTHGHFDHLSGAKGLREEYGVPVFVSANEKELLENLDLDRAIHENPESVFPFYADRYLADNEELNLCDTTIQVLPTPGHSAGSVSYYLPDENLVFSGDTLFRESVGRSDFPTGNTLKLMSSIRGKLYALPDETIVYPGHGEATQIGYERINNPYVRKKK